MKNIYTILVGKPEKISNVGLNKSKPGISKIDFKEMRCEDLY
jgi:hypothetical protein